MLCALLSLLATGCHETNVTPASVPPPDLASAVAVSTDMAGVVSTDMARVVAVSTDMAAATVPSATTVIVGANGTLTFTPQNVTIAAGGTVTWNWAPGNTLLHNVTSDTGLFASATQMSGSFSHTFPSAGSFFYFCTVHGRNVMNGTITVR
jgi:plastocyanin